MLKITLTAEGEIDELTPILKKLSELNETQTPQKYTDDQGWTQERILSIWNELSDNAKTVLTVIAQNDDKSWDEQVKLTGWSHQQVGGSLSSLGARLRNHSLKGIASPLYDNEADGYKLIQSWKEAILKFSPNRK